MMHLVISFMAPDRPGVVDSLANLITQKGGNWQDSSMHHLSGYFAGVVEVAVAENAIDTLVSEIKALPELETIIKISHTEPSEQTPSVILELTANDRSGIVQEISSIIHHQGGNLLKLVSNKASAPHTGQNLFKAKVTIAVADDAVDELIDALENLADDLMVDISR